jgi:hypothetical protein
MRAKQYSGLMALGALVALVMFAVLLISLAPLVDGLSISSGRVAAQAEAEEVRDLRSGEIDTEKSHGTTKHPTDARIVRRCLDRNGPIEMFFHPEKRFYLRVCDLGPVDEEGNGRYFGLQILGRSAETGRWFEASSYIPFLEDKTLPGLIKWLLKQGWVAFKGG